MKAPLQTILAGIATVAVLGPALVVATAPVVQPRARMPRLPAQRVIPATIVPPVEPVKFVDLDPEEARAFNETVPFSTVPNPAARPFRFPGGADDLARATDCLAAGTLYEAGDDTVGERAVAQVVLNRLRHPAFPKSICAVVFEGEQRRTGCQFSFSCDGATSRWQPTDAAWDRARQVARAALSGAVYRPVGYATHYHTDWVVPYWQASLDKIARVGTHLFFRWSGWWGTPPAFGRQASGVEPMIAQLAAFSPAHGAAPTLADSDAAIVEASTLLGFAPVVAQATAAGPAGGGGSGDGQTFLVRLDPRAGADSYRAMALTTCGDRPHCTVMGWSGTVPPALPLEPQQMAAMGFSYLRDRENGFEKALWNCAEFRRAVPGECMKRQMTLRAEPAAVATPVPVRGPGELIGVRRATPAPAPTQN